jgi:outer membrane protein OmpA-like peptidoglycan-associated protein
MRLRVVRLQRPRLTEDELDGALSAASAELAAFVRAAADPDSGLMRIMTAEEASGAAQTAGTPPALRHAKRGWRWTAISVALALAGVIGGYAIGGLQTGSSLRAASPAVSIPVPLVPVPVAGPYTAVAAAVTFPLNQARLSQSAATALRALARQLSSQDRRGAVTVTGYASAVGGPVAANVNLALLRAEAVRTWLLKYLPASRWNVVSDASITPYKLAGTAEADRRVVLTIIFTTSSVGALSTRP